MILKQTGNLARIVILVLKLRRLIGKNELKGNNAELRRRIVFILVTKASTWCQLPFFILVKHFKKFKLFRVLNPYYKREFLFQITVNSNFQDVFLRFVPQLYFVYWLFYNIY